MISNFRLALVVVLIITYYLGCFVLGFVIENFLGVMAGLVIWTGIMFSLCIFIHK